MSALGGLLGDYDSDNNSNVSDEGGIDGGKIEGGDAIPEPRTDAGKEVSILDKLPPPKVGAKRSVRFVLPFDLSTLGKDGDEDDDKESKPVMKSTKTGKSKLLDYLPPPKRQSKGRVPALGEGSMTHSTREPHPEVSISSAGPNAQGPELANNETYRVKSHGSQLGSDDPASSFSNEMYRVDHSEIAPVSTPSIHPGVDHGEMKPDGRSAVETVLGMALEQESKKKLKGDTPEHFGIEFKEIRQSDLKYVDPTVRESASSVGAAFGSDYASQLRGQAAPFKGSKIAKRKHQIGTLYHTVKMNELEAMASKAQGVKSKHETEAKYGWR
ncbi:hypothetical protein BSKO_08406 [Bryopsis sp. KO-2023]|nr:hypothetical protein BSKO_08406 [Bryopsis sp. KO-2023]